MRVNDKKYPYLYISEGGSIWAAPFGNDREGLMYLVHLGKTKEYLNEQVELVVKGVKHFVCSSCGEAKNKEDFVAQVFAGWYCNDCSEIPRIAKNIRESKQSGFYD